MQERRHSIPWMTLGCYSLREGVNRSEGQSQGSLMLELARQRQRVDWSLVVGYCLQFENIKRKTWKSSLKIAKQAKAETIVSGFMVSGLHPGLLHGCVSLGLGTTKFTNLIGWNRYWKRSKFYHIDRLYFAVKKLQNKTLFLQQYLLMEVPKSVMRKNVAELSSLHRRPQEHCPLVQTSCIKRISKFFLFASN